MDEFILEISSGCIIEIENDKILHLDYVSDTIGQDIIVGTQDGYVYRLRPDGSEVWITGSGGYSIKSIIIDNTGNICMATLNPDIPIIQLDQFTGNGLLQYESNIIPNCLAMQSDGKILVGHSTGILRLNTDYTVDGTFDGGELYEKNVSAILINSSDMIVGVNDMSGGTMYSLTSEGAYIATWFGGTAINCLAIQQDNKILAGTDSGVYRFNADGNIDESWATITELSVNDICVRSEDEILIAGDNENDNAISLLSSDGNLINQYGNGKSFKIIIQSDGKIINGIPLGIIRYESDYTTDISFSSTITSQVNAIVLINN